MRAALADLGEDTFTEGHELDRKASRHSQQRSISRQAKRSKAVVLFWSARSLALRSDVSSKRYASFSLSILGSALFRSLFASLSRPWR